MKSSWLRIIGIGMFLSGSAAAMAPKGPALCLAMGGSFTAISECEYGRGLMADKLILMLQGAPYLVCCIPEAACNDGVHQTEDFACCVETTKFRPSCVLEEQQDGSYLKSIGCSLAAAKECPVDFN